MRKESKCPRGVYKVKSFGTLQEIIEMISFTYIDDPYEIGGVH